MNWKEKYGKAQPTQHSFLAPEWYITMKRKRAPEKEVFEAVRNFCVENMPEEEVDDAFVALMIESYEA